MDDWLRMSEIAHMANGELHGDDVIVSGVSTDTRNLKFGDLFVALQGENFDGHKFIDDSIEQIVRGVFVHQAVTTTLPMVKVEDTLAGMTRWAHAWRKKLNPKLIAITGSNGKTTVKQMVTNIFNQAGTVCATKGNLNNHIGVPLTLLSLRVQHQFAIIEMGANHHGEIHHLSTLAQPDVALITNAGPAHLEGFGSVAGVANAKGEIIDGIRARGTIVLNADDPYLDVWMQKAQHCRVVTFGFGDQALIRGVALTEKQLRITSPEYELTIQLQVLGKHNMYNALAAAAAAYAMALPAENIVDGLQSFCEVSGRLQVKQGVLGATIIDDTYNANPASLRAAIDVLCAQRGEPWLVLGDMGELGKDAESIHAQMGAMAREAGVKKLFGIGAMAAHAVAAFGENGLHFQRHDQLSKELLSCLNSDCCVLVKGSRAMHMEDVVKLVAQSTTLH